VRWFTLFPVIVFYLIRTQFILFLYFNILFDNVLFFMQSHPFRNFSLSLYRKPGVADACLFVQDRYGLNVNVILFCIWVADIGNGTLASVQITTALRRVADWEDQVIQPLREIRRTCRKEALGVPEFLLQTFLPQIETTELEAEHVEQLVLTELAGSLVVSADDSPGSAENDAVCSLKAYISVLDIVQDVPLTECLSVILHAAFTGANFPADEDS
jgi:uncharacterized protein (TIGR02444 family)